MNDILTIDPTLTPMPSCNNTTQSEPSFNIVRFGQSLFLGKEGRFRLFNIPVTFEKPPFFFFCDKAGVYSNPHENVFMRKFKDLANWCCHNTAFQIGSLGTLHVLVHEMGHALAAKYFSDKPSIQIFHIKNRCTGGRTNNCQPMNISKVAHSIIAASGSLANIAFSSTLLVGSCAIINTWAWPISMIVGAGSFLWMTGELLYAHTAIVNNDRGDFASIDPMHVRVAAAALTGLYAIGLISAYAVIH